MLERCAIVLGPGTDRYTIKQIRFKVGSERGSQEEMAGDDTFVSSVNAAAEVHSGTAPVVAEVGGKTVIVKEGQPSQPDSRFNPGLVSSLLQRRLG